MKKKNRPLKLLSVCRVSSREQSEGYSLEAQDKANREWAEHKGHEIAESIQYVETASKQKERQRFREIINRICSDLTINGVVFHKVDRACRNLTDLAMAYLNRMLFKDVADTQNELRTLKRKASETQPILDGLLLKAAQAEDDLAKGFMHLARQKQQETALLQRRIEQIKTGKRENSREPAKIIELAQGLAEKYVTFRPPQNRQIMQSVFSNLELDNVNLCGDYRLPFSILAENGTRPLNSG